jgi:CHAT domain-containing protein
LDYAIPSYIPSFQHLAFPSDTAAKDPPHVLVISQPDTPGHTPLPCTVLEVSEIKRFVPPEQVQVYEGERGDKSALLNMSYELARTKPLILHLACHAKQVTSDPFQSAFFLYDGQVPVSSLLWSQNDRPVLAVLSACETGAVDEVRPDEFLNIGASMHCMKKFPSVVATLWGINDSDGPSMAESLYETMFKTKLDSASGLRIAANHMRSKQVPPVRWVPFVHFGI